MSRCRSDMATCEAPLHQHRQPGGGHRDGDVDESGDRVDLEVFEGDRAHLIRLTHQLVDRDRVRERGSLEGLDRQSHQRRDGRADALGQDHSHKRGERAESQSCGCLALRFVDGLQPRANGFRRVGGDGERESERRGGEVLEQDPDRRETVVRDLQHHQGGDAAADLDDDQCRPSQPGSDRGGAEREDQTDQVAADHRDGRELQADAETVEEARVVLGETHQNDLRRRVSSRRATTASGMLTTR
jgi:hypothetical protein